MKRMACALALTAGVGLGAGVTATSALAETIVMPAASGLTLTVNTTETLSADAPLTLDVRFDGGSLRLVELLIDGATVKKKNLATRASRGHLEFQMEAGLLSEGPHDILIKAQDADGNTATTSAHIKVMPGASGLVKFAFPRNKAMVQGVVPLEIKLDASIHNPYVSFFIDDIFLSLTNYAPFSVNWDSARVTNGQHTISVEVYDGDTLAKVKATSLQITVNNPGGLTTRQKEIQDLGKKPTDPVHAAAQGMREAVDASRYSADPHANLSFHTPDEMVTRLMAPPANTTLLRSPETRPMSALGSHVNSIPTTAPKVSPLTPHGKTAELLPTSINTGEKTTVKPNALGNIDRAANNADHARVKVNKPGLMGMIAMPLEFTALRAPVPMTGRLAPITFRPRRAGNMAARPSLTMETGTAISATPEMTRNSVHARPLAPATDNITARIAPIKIARSNMPLLGPGAITGKGRTMQVAFDNTRIAFDVQPRVEHGMPLAPFRQIFEHTGGTIQWYNQSKTLRAFNSTREIEFKVGEDEAKVNNQTVKMEAKTYLEKGRTIVPLSFVRDALDVKVSYDATTGHLRIESKK